MYQNKESGFYSVNKGDYTEIFMSREGPMTGYVCCKPGKSGNKDGGWEVVARLQAEQDTLQLQEGCLLCLGSSGCSLAPPTSAHASS